MNGYYPIVLRLRGKRCVVVGGGGVAERKVDGLLEAGADEVIVVSPKLTERLERLALEGKVHLKRRAYLPSDAEGAAVMFAATDDPSVNERVAEDANRFGALVGVADRPARGDFISPAVVRRGDLLIAVSAAGTSPSLAVRVKKELEEQYGDEYAAFAERLGELRSLVLSTIADAAKRSAVLRLAAQEKAPFASAGETPGQWLKRLMTLTDDT